MEAKTIRARMNCLQAVFKQAKEYATTSEDVEAMAIYNNTLVAPFVSVAYEATAMVLAIADSNAGDNLRLWAKLLSQHKEHATQIYIGLGWALAQERKRWNSYLEDLNPIYTWRVVDGYGYYDGFFRRRKVFQGSYPEGLTEEALSVYMQGLGRSLWYTSKGEVTKLLSLLNKLPQVQLPNLWRGIGIASTYVGGEELKMGVPTLRNAIGSYQAAFVTGAAMAIESRKKAAIIDHYSQWASEEWCQMSVDELNKILIEKIKGSTYFDRIRNTEAFFYSKLSIES